MKRPTAGEHLIRAATLQCIDRVLRDFGLDADRELAVMKLTPAMFDDSDALIDILELAETLEYCIGVTGSHGFPLQLAAHQSVQFSGRLGLLLQTSTTLGAALEELHHFIHVHAQPVTWSTELFGDAAAIRVSVEDTRLTALQHRACTDLALAQGYQSFRAFTAGRFTVNRVQVHYDRGDDAVFYRRYFQAPIEFNAEQDALVISADALQWPVRPADTVLLHESIRQQLANDWSDRHPTLAQEVRVIIRSLLPSRQCSVERVARAYGCDKRTLQRHLQAECGTSYQALLDEVRIEFAQQYLRTSNMPLKQLAYMVGFTDTSNFARAFRKQVGSSPRQWRAEHQERANVGPRLKLR